MADDKKPHALAIKPIEAKPRKMTQLELDEQVLSLVLPKVGKELRLDQAAAGARVHAMMAPDECLKNLMGFADAIQLRLSIYMNTLTLLLVEPEELQQRAHGRKKAEPEIVLPAGPDLDRLRLAAARRIDLMAPAMQRLGDYRKNLAEEFRERIPQRSEDTFFRSEMEPEEWTSRAVAYAKKELGIDLTTALPAPPPEADAKQKTNQPKNKPDPKGGSNRS